MEQKKPKIGKLKYFDPKKGFGFIREHNTNAEVFVTKKNIKYHAKEMDIVVFLWKPRKNKPGKYEAYDVTKAPILE